MRSFFISGTDTAIGKTVVTGLIAKYLALNGKKVITQKWIQTGCDSFPDDILSHLNMMGKKPEDIESDLKYVNPYCLSFPGSPHLAAKLEGVDLDPEKVKESYRVLSEKYESVIIEGIGGALVPFNDELLVIDIVKELDIPVVLVAGNRLGAINHTLLTIEALKNRGLRLKGIVYNDLSKQSDKKILDDNPEIIAKFSGISNVSRLSHINDNEALYADFMTSTFPRSLLEG